MNEAEPASPPTPPELRLFTPAEYPEPARRLGLEATVLLELLVESTGRVGEVRVIEAAGHGFDEAAATAAWQFVFEPAHRGERSLAARIRYRYRFKLARGGEGGQAPAPSERASSEGGDGAPRGPASGGLTVRAQLAGLSSPLAGAQVWLTSLDGKRRVLLTGLGGECSSGDLTPGPYELEVRAEGFRGEHRRVDVRAGRELQIVVALRVEAQGQDDAREVRVVEERTPATTRRTISRRELESMPGTLGDPLRALQNLPGVSVVPLGSGDLIVRGLEPRSSLVYVDGLPVLNAYHLWGIASVVPAEMLQSLEFYPGNYGVEYGRGLGSLTELRTRRGRQDGRYHAMAQVDAIDSRAMVEGPIPGLRGWSIIGAARRSHLDKTLMPVLGWDVSPVYYDYQAFIETHPTRRSRLRLGIFGSQDHLTFRDPSEEQRFVSETTFWYFLGQYDVYLTDELHWEHTTAVGFLHNSFEFKARDGAASADNPAYPIGVRASLTWEPSQAWRLTGGTDIHYAPYRAELDIPEPPASDAQPTVGSLSEPQVQLETSELYLRPAWYTELLLAPNDGFRWLLGLRADYTRGTRAWDLSPRTRASYRWGPPAWTTRLTAGMGLFHQPPLPEESLPGFGTPDLRSSRAVHTTLGVDQRLFGRASLGIEGYLYELSRLIERGSDRGGQLEYQNSGSGHTLGVESLLRYDASDNLYGWVAYTLARSVRRSDDDEPLTLTGEDQTHLLTALVSYRLGAGWELGARLQYASGTPYTPVESSIFSSSADRYVPVEGPRNSRRLPALHQLDLRAQKAWQLDWLRLTGYVDVLNCYGNRRVVSVRYNDDFSASEYERFPLPVIPSLGLRGEF